MPNVDAVAAVQSVALPVIVNPFRRNLIPDEPKLMQGEPTTIQVTSPTSSLFSVIVSVEEMVPLISVAWRRAGKTRSKNTDRTKGVNGLKKYEPIGPPYAVAHR